MCGLAPNDPWTSTRVQPVGRWSHLSLSCQSTMWVYISFGLVVIQCYWSFVSVWWLRSLRLRAAFVGVGNDTCDNDDKCVWKPQQDVLASLIAFRHMVLTTLKESTTLYSESRPWGLVTVSLLQASVEYYKNVLYKQFNKTLSEFC